MRLRIVCILVILFLWVGVAMPVYAIALEMRYRYAGYHTQEKSLTDTEWNQGTVIIKTVSFSKERKIISEITDESLREIVQNYVRSPEFVAKVPMPPYGEWMGKKWNPSNISEFHVYKLYDTTIGMLYALDFQCYVDKDKSHESGIVIIFVIKGKELFPLLTRKWGHWHSGEYTDKRFYGLVGEEIILRKICVSGVRYVFYKYTNNQIEAIQAFYDEQTDASQYFNPD